MALSLTRLEAVERAAMLRSGEEIPFVINGHSIKFANGMEYNPHPTLEKFHSDNSKIRLIMGPYRSGKSVAACMEILLRACAMPKCLDGIRRCKVGVVRNTYDRLSNTTVKTWDQWGRQIGLIGQRSKPSIQREYVFNDGNGIVELDLLFLALDKEIDIDKLASLEVTFLFANEFRQIPYMMMSHFFDRTGCYPPKVICPDSYWRGIWLDTNPPNIRSQIRRDFEVIVPKGYKLFKQPPGLLKDDKGEWIKNPKAENVENLPDNYYLDMVSGATEEHIKVYACNQYGSTYEGQKVYKSYNDNLHAVDTIEISKDNSILLAFDYGRVCPACLLLQFVDGQLRAIKEFIGTYMSVDKLYEIVIGPYLAVHCEGLAVETIGDPANTGEGQQLLEKCGLDAYPARTNKIETRINTMEIYLRRLVDEGIPGFILSKQECPTLHDGFLGAYHYKKLQVVGDGNYKDVPEKNHPYSDIHDCAQYAALHFTQNEAKSTIDTDDFSEAHAISGWN